MARLKTVGFESNSVAEHSEIYEVAGSPYIVTNVDVNSGLVSVWDSDTDAWDSHTAPWPSSLYGAVYEPEGVRSGHYAARIGDGDAIRFSATLKEGGCFFRAYVRFSSLPQNESSAFLSFRRSSDQKAMVEVDLTENGTLSLQYREDADTDPTTVSPFSAPIQTNRYYLVELAILGDEVGTDRHLEARIDGVLFVQADVNISATDGHFVLGIPADETTWNDPNQNWNSLEAPWNGKDFDFYVDDIGINNAIGDVQNTYPGPGKVILLPVVGDDEHGNAGWTLGGRDDTGSYWENVKYSSPPDQRAYIIGDDNSDRIDFKVGNPFDVGLKLEDTIKVVAANAHWRLAGAGDSNLYIYLRAGSGLSREGASVALSGTSWMSGDPNGRNPDMFSSATLPNLNEAWSTEDVASARIGVEAIDATPDIHIAALWVLVDYVPYGDLLDYSVTINGVERVQDIELQSLQIADQLNEQANTADFVLYDLHGLGVPETDDEVIVRVNGVKLFAGTVVKTTYTQLGVLADKISINCVDHTRILDRHLVSATFTNMTDKEIIEAIVDQFVFNVGVDAYYVSEGVTVSQISFNYIPASQAIKQLAELSARSWFIDYDKHIHYFPRQTLQAPFQITSAGSYHKNLQLAKDSSRLRNRVFVRGGTEITTDPITERVVADGERRTFNLAEKPHDITITVDAVPQTVGIKNIDEADDFDWLVNFQEKYIEAGTATLTPTSGQVVEISYNYDVPVLVSVEDAVSVGQNGIYEFAIIDSQIATTQQARDRAVAELTDYANDLVDATYTTYEPGIRSGMFQRITMANKDVDEDYLVNALTLRSLGGGRFVYEVKLTNAKTLGIIQFLINLLQTDRRVGKIDPNERVDQLFTLTDGIDSMIDSLVIDSNVTNFVWAADSYAPGTKPGNALKWDLGAWS